MPFSPTAQTALNVGIVVNGFECKRPRLVYAKKKLKDDEKRAIKRLLNGYRFLCGSTFQEMAINERESGAAVLQKVFIRENISCVSNMETSYFSCRIYRKVCIYCGCGRSLIDDNSVDYPQCCACIKKSRIKIPKRKKILSEDLQSSLKKSRKD